MKISVSTTFLGSLSQNTFTVRTTETDLVKEYRCTYEAGEWGFLMYADKDLLLECRRVKLPGKATFLGRQRYQLFFEDEEIAILNKSYFQKELVRGDKTIRFPSLLTPAVNELGLRFPRRSLIYRRSVTSTCTATDPQEIMLAIAMTIFIWLTRNGLPAD